MKNEEVVNIKGRQFNKETGLPLNSFKKPMSSISKPLASGARNIHAGMQKSQTLIRRAAKRPDQLKAAGSKSMDISRSARISRFAPNPIFKNTVTRINKNVDDIQKQKLHPLMKKVNKSLEISHVQPAKTMQQTKAEEIKKTIENTVKSKRRLKKRASLKDIKHRKLIISSGIILGVALLMYVSYQFIPAISIRIAASQAKINASYPTYTPDGFHMTGPITFDDSNVVIKYKQNSSDKTYAIYQSNSTWDSSALQLNLADAWSAKNIIRAGGITIFTTSNYEKAAWVNHGILYKITADSDLLDSDKITRIVSSM
jgi:hypothetical protein